MSGYRGYKHPYKRIKTYTNGQVNLNKKVSKNSQISVISAILKISQVNSSSILVELSKMKSHVQIGSNNCASRARVNLPHIGNRQCIKFFLHRNLLKMQGSTFLNQNLNGRYLLNIKTLSFYFCSLAPR
jgi:hypothetical protein